ncbi:MAG: RsmF rRNA methyltransferase first C-terminal domain-containing protein [Lachnospiraceae bacterium]
MTYENLPDSFLASMEELLGEEFQAYLNSYKEERWYGLRVNRAKLTPEQFEAVCPFSIESVPWISNGYYYKEESRPSKHPYYYAGLYYLQEPSAMTPANLLPVEPGDRVLDLCGAPGGKSTELGAKLQGKGILVANDISNSRAKALLKNLELLGIPNICVTSETPERLSQVFPLFFDKILIDAPCSGEGMFRKDDSMIESWKEHGPEYYAGIQRQIVTEAVKMLRPGGLLLYSTCTFSPLENEDTIRWLLKTEPDLELVPLPLFPGASDGIGLTGCIRLFPHKIKGEGHFIAMLHKKGKAEETQGKNPLREKAYSLEQDPDVRDFFHQLSLDLDPKRIVLKQDCLYYLPEEFPAQAKLRFLRTGLWLGTIKKKRFEPSQALAMVLSPDTFSTSLSFTKEDDRVIRYLKGETISLSPDEPEITGWCLVCVDGYPLGFAKGNGRVLKNKYYPGWRWQ